MIAAWQTNDLSYGAGFGMMLMDETIFEGLFSSLQDRKSTWHLFGEDKTEIYHEGQDRCTDPDELIRKSNNNKVLHDKDGHAFSAFSKTMENPAWTLIRKVSMEDYEQVVIQVSSVSLFGATPFKLDGGDYPYS